MTAMLASVRSIPEARRAHAAGVDVVDCKDPAQGALGALAPCSIRAIVSELGAKTCISAAAGELQANAAIQAAAVLPIAASGVDFVKVGLPQGVDASAWSKNLGQLAARGVRIVAVLFADRCPSFSVLTELASAGIRGVMLDTADKTRGGLCSQMSQRDLCRFVDQAKGLGLLTGLAGSLQIADIPRLAPLRPDYLGFRGALCNDAGRQGELESAATLAVRRTIADSVRPCVSGPLSRARA